MPSPREAKHFLSRFWKGNDPNAVPSDDASVQQRHIGLIKLQGFMSFKQLRSFAFTLVQLQTLGLSPVIVLDFELSDRSSISQIQEDDKWAWHTGKHGPQPKLHRKRPRFVSNESKRDQFYKSAALKECFRVAEVIDGVGGGAMTVPTGAFACGPDLEEVVCGSDTPILKAFALRQIPVLAPIGSTALSSKNVSLPPQSCMIALARSLGKASSIKLFSINSFGGLSVESGHLNFVNLADDFDDLALQLSKSAGVNREVMSLSGLKGINKFSALSWQSVLSFYELSTAQAILRELPSSSSAIIASAQGSSTLIRNLITDKPVQDSETFTPSFGESLSLEPGLVRGDAKAEADLRYAPLTVLRQGLHVESFSSLEGVDLVKLKSLLESSFGKVLSVPYYWDQVKDKIGSIIVAGDYQGAAIVTKEGEGVAYLDKFAVAPTSQGLGVADILWTHLQRGFKDLFWRSRSNNPVNKW
ncbi:Amino-acid acetyltransferase, mitochondrial [Dinochytrium kinnereticum]|nr:Amino-acid acetyltransferase, mitochondrial [Dinochytrium kinnereticum]